MAHGKKEKLLNREMKQSHKSQHRGTHILSSTGERPQEQALPRKINQEVSL